MSALANYGCLPGPGEIPLSYSRRSPSFASWDGPSYREGRDPPCEHCDATGLIEDGERIDVDDYRDCVCSECNGTGIGEPRHAGDRYTGYPRGMDPLTYLAGLRRARHTCPAAGFRYGYTRQRAVSPLDHPLPGAATPALARRNAA